ncbi:unnamed protein product [Pleuronectes platessa]|uniref:Uncharacterized protein n=1 Tax=Pleuronectes platessa TaxID=8262 RepID=A0A9N7UWH6_PLEPL|nr:unnamed protein product [Pleuronectes platessa]
MSDPDGTSADPLGVADPLLKTSGLMSQNLRFLVPTANHTKGERMVSTCVVPTVKHGRGGVMDNEPKHTSRLCKGYLTKKESDGVLRQRTWPPQPPDLNANEMG